MHLADLPLDSEKLLLPGRLDPGGKLPVQGVRGSPFLTGELKDADALESHLLDEVA